MLTENQRDQKRGKKESMNKWVDVCKSERCESNCITYHFILLLIFKILKQWLKYTKKRSLEWIRKITPTVCGQWETISPSFLVTWTGLRNTEQTFFGAMSLNLDLSVFLMMGLGLCVWGKEVQRSKVETSSQLIKSTFYRHDLWGPWGLQSVWA